MLRSVFSQVERKLFEITKQDLKYSNLCMEEWRAIVFLPYDRCIFKKKTDKG